MLLKLPPRMFASVTELSEVKIGVSFFKSCYAVVSIMKRGYLLTLENLKLKKKEENWVVMWIKYEKNVNESFIWGSEKSYFQQPPFLVLGRWFQFSKLLHDYNFFAFLVVYQKNFNLLI